MHVNEMYQSVTTKVLATFFGYWLQTGNESIRYSASDFRAAFDLHYPDLTFHKSHTNPPQVLLTSKLRFRDDSILSACILGYFPETGVHELDRRAV
jgi:hypothetical protein